MTRETGGNTADSKFDTSRRRFLGSSGLAAIGAVIGGVLPLSRNGAGIPQAHAQAAPAAAPPSPAPAKGPQYLKFPGKNEGLVVLGEKPLVAETPESLLDDDTTADREILHSQQRADPRGGEESRRLEDHH